MSHQIDLTPPLARARVDGTSWYVPTAACRGCGGPLDRKDALCDLGAQPLANALLAYDDLDKPTVHFPLRPLVCRRCLLVQLPDVLPADAIFTDAYPFHASQSAAWLAHCKEFARTAKHRFRLDATSRVLDIGSNDGSMLRPFRGMGIPALGVEPCRSVAQHALMEGLPTFIVWWGTECSNRLTSTGGYSMAAGGWRADLVTCTNVLAHVPNLGDFLAGVHGALRPGGTAMFEVPYVGNLIDGRQFDQIYAEHHCYFGLHSLGYALVEARLFPYDVAPMPTHGGSIRVYARRMGDDHHEGTNTVRWGKALAEEHDRGLTDVDAYLSFAAEPPAVKRQALETLAGLGAKRMAGYGASAKATVMLNYLGVGPEWIEFVADTTPAKQGKWLPGCRIPVRSPQHLTMAQPDAVVLLAWNWAEEAAANIRRDCPDAKIVTLNGTTVPRAAMADRRRFPASDQLSA